MQTIIWRSERDTQAFAERLAVEPALRDAVVELHGNLGAGKTTLVRHLLRALGVQGRIKSPTYAVAEPYELPGNATLPGSPAWHFDFYRFTDPREWEDAGFRDIFIHPGLKLIEWADNVRAVLPTPDLAVLLQLGDAEARVVTLDAKSYRGQQLLKAVAAS